MAQVRTGIRAALQHPVVFTSFQNFIGATKLRKELIKYLELKDGLKLLDVGCGPGDVLDLIKEDIQYTGFDFEASYIESAKAKFGKRGEFIVADVNTYDFGSTKFDRIHISGVLHHLEDHEVKSLMENLSRILSPDGFIICLENVYIHNQNPVAKKLISMDRGKNVRTEKGYVDILKSTFANIKCVIRHDLLRIPYTHIIMKLSM